MYSIFYDDLASRLYPSSILHAYGVNGKISGSVGAIGEIGGNVVAVLHAPVGSATITVIRHAEGISRFIRFLVRI